MDWYFDNILTWNGRASRSQFIVQGILLIYLLPMLFGLSSSDEMGVLDYILVAAVLILPIFLIIRRLHDIGMSGFWVIGGLMIWLFATIVNPTLGYVLYIGFPVLLALSEGEGNNQYGRDPLSEK